VPSDNIGNVPALGASCCLMPIWELNVFRSIAGKRIRAERNATYDLIADEFKTAIDHWWFVRVL
jgi:hypothetical protein